MRRFRPFCLIFSFLSLVASAAALPLEALAFGDPALCNQPCGVLSPGEGEALCIADCPAVLGLGLDDTAMAQSRLLKVPPGDDLRFVLDSERVSA